MASGDDLIAWARLQVGKPYNASSDLVRFGPASYDCSGLVVAGAKWVGAPLPREMGTNSASMARYLIAQGLTRPVEVALHTAGAVLIMGPANGTMGYGPLGHIALSVGNGADVIEARGTAWGVVEDLGKGRNWTNAGILPGIQTLSTPSTPPHTGSDGLAAVYHALHDVGTRYNGRHSPVLRIGSSGRNVSELQLALAGLGCRIAIDGEYGPKTCDAVKLIQRQGYKQADGVVGLKTYTYLSYLLLLRFP